MSDNIDCPHCRKTIRMDECERYSRHTSYWGEDAPQEEDCPHCNRSFWIIEHVRRTWSAHRTLDAAANE